MVVENRVARLEWRQTEDGAKGKNPPPVQEPPPFVGDEQANASKADAKAQEFLRRQKLIEAQKTL